MEKRTCKLCFKTFSNGRALGGHMRSHMLKLQTPPPPLPTPPPPPTPLNVHASSHVHHLQNTQLIHQLDGDETDSASSSSSSEAEEDEDEDDDKGLSYGLRENPKKSFRLVDPEFSSFAVDAGSVVQDRESETESSKNPSRRRSKRNRKSGFHEQTQQNDGLVSIKKNKPNKPIAAESLIEPEPLSSVSDTTPEEDVAWCLMMLSRGIRTRKFNEVEVEENQEDEAEEEDEDDEEDEKSIEESDEELEEIKIRVKRSRGKYQCGTCKKFFRSYQALGGHRASHKKIKGCNININMNMNMSMNMNMNMNINTPSSSSLPVAEYDQQEGNAGSVAATAPRIHECPVCFRVFGSGQALGGHKRSHITGSSSLQPIRVPNSTRFENNLIDLNLPAPMEDEDQIELSAVSDGEFIH